MYHGNYSMYSTYKLYNMVPPIRDLNDLINIGNLKRKFKSYLMYMGIISLVYIFGITYFEYKIIINNSYISITSILKFCRKNINNRIGLLSLMIKKQLDKL